MYKRQGTTCNAYDGFAVDAIRIAEAAPNVAAFTATCRSQNEMDFAFDAPCATSFAWNFGDAGSGTQNTGTGANISHTFSAPGLYTVSAVSYTHLDVYKRQLYGSGKAAG